MVLGSISFFFRLVNLFVFLFIFIINRYFYSIRLIESYCKLIKELEIMNGEEIRINFYEFILVFIGIYFIYFFVF